MRCYSAFAALWVVLMFASNSALARSQRPDPETIMASAAKSAFQKLKAEVDKNRDGKLSKAEFFAMYKDKAIAGKNYAAWDLNKDGFIAEEEYVKAVVDIGKRRKK